MQRSELHLHELVHLLGSLKVDILHSLGSLLHLHELTHFLCKLFDLGKFALPFNDLDGALLGDAICLLSILNQYVYFPLAFLHFDVQ